MAKPDFSDDIQNLAVRSKRLRAIVADQKKEEGSDPVDIPNPQQTATDSSKGSFERNSKQKTRVASESLQPSLSQTVEQLIESDNPARLKDDEREWSRRLTYISTRIPEDMRNLIDDLLFILKKEARNDLNREPTLQDLACEAWGDLLGKYRQRLSR